MQTLRWWLRIVGVFYVLQFVLNAIVHAPISTVGPKDALALASAGDPLARFLVDTWVTFGLEIGAIGVALVVASRTPEQGRLLVWAIIAIELARGIANDVYMIARGYDVTVFIIWIVIHSVVILTGLRALGRTALRDIPLRDPQRLGHKMPAFSDSAANEHT
jgi:hypothetical protein